MAGRELGKRRNPRLLYGEVVQTDNCTRYITKVNSTNGNKPVVISIVHKDTIERIEEKTASRFTDAGWDSKLSIACSVKKSELELVNVFCLLRKQMDFRERIAGVDGYSVRPIPDPLNADDIIEQIAELDRKVGGGRERFIKRIRTKLLKHLAVVATKDSEVAGFLVATRRDDKLAQGVSLIDMYEPVVSEDHPMELGVALMRAMVNDIHCFQIPLNFVIMSQRAFDVGMNAEMASIGFEPSYPVERDDGTFILWTYDSSRDLRSRIDLSGKTEDETKEKITRMFRKNPDMSANDAIGRYRMPGFDRARVIALKAVASSKATKKQGMPKIENEGATLGTEDEIREVFRKYPDMSVKELRKKFRIPKKFTVKDGKETPFILAGIKAHVTMELKSGKQPKQDPRPKTHNTKPETRDPKPKGSKRQINTPEDVRRVFQERGLDFTVPQMRAEYDVHPSLVLNDKGEPTTQRLAGIKAAITSELKRAGTI